MKKIIELNVPLPKLPIIIFLFFRIWCIHVMSISSSNNLALFVITPILPLPLLFAMDFCWMGHNKNVLIAWIIRLLSRTILAAMTASYFLVSTVSHHSFQTRKTFFAFFSLTRTSTSIPCVSNLSDTKSSSFYNIPALRSLSHTHVDVQHWNQRDDQ